MKTNIINSAFAIGRSFCVAMVAFCGFTATPSNAAVVVYTEQVGADVILTYSGALDVTGTGSPYGASNFHIGGGLITSAATYLLFGGDAAMDFRDHAFSSNSGSVGTTNSLNASSSTGNPLFFSGNAPFGTIGLLVGYAGEQISGMMTFAGTTIAGMGLIQNATRVGTLKSGDTITWNTFADPNSSLTAVPLPAAFPLFAAGLGLLGLLGWRRKQMDTAV